MNNKPTKNKLEDGWVSVHDRLPTEHGIYSVKRRHGDEITQTLFEGSFTNYHGYAVSHWLDKNILCKN